jgi:serine/threonine protein kinase
MSQKSCHNDDDGQSVNFEAGSLLSFVPGQQINLVGQKHQQPPILGESSSSSSMTTFERTASISNRYIYEKFINAGSFGAVFLAHLASDEKKKVAIKIATEDSSNRELRRECVLLAQLPPDLNVVNVIDVEREAFPVSSSSNNSSSAASSSSFSGFSSTHHHQSNQKIGLVMEYCAGGSLFDYINSRKQNIQQQEQQLLFSEKEVAIMALQILSGLRFLHEAKIIHRDIKPGNILLLEKVAENENQSIILPLLKLSDFGLVHNNNNNHQQKNTTSAAIGVAGTVAFLSPEALEGRAGAPSDMWAVGCTLCQLLSGKSPWQDLRNKCASQGQQFYEMKRLLKISSDRTHEAVLETIRENLLPKSGLISKEGENFLLRLLDPDSSLRPTAQEILDQCEENSSAPDTCWIIHQGGQEAKELLAKIKKFSEDRYERCYKQLLAHPDQALPYVVFARLLPNNKWISLKHRTDCRQGLFNEATNIEPNNDLYHFLLASELESMLIGDGNSADTQPQNQIHLQRIQHCYEKCVSICPDDANYWLRLGMSVRNRARVNGEELSAKECLVKALNLDPSLAVAWSAVGRELKTWNMLKEIEVRGQKYNYYDCFKKAASLIEEQSEGLFFDSNSASPTLTTAKPGNNIMETSSSENSSSSNKKLQSLVPRLLISTSSSSTNSSQSENSSNKNSTLAPTIMTMANTSSLVSSSTITNTKNNLTALPSNSEMNLELVTAIVSKGKPMEFWTSLARAIPLRSIKTQQQQHSRAQCFKKALDSDSTSNILLWFEFAISLFYEQDDADVSERERLELISQSLGQIILISLTMIESASSREKKWEILS